MNSGIYKAEIGPNFYYGRAQDIGTRLSGHKHHLENGTHINPHMQHAFNKYGEFTTTVVASCAVEDLPRYEAVFVNRSLDNPRCMNIAGVDPNGSHLVSDETKARTSAAKKAFYATSEGRAHHQDTFWKAVVVRHPDGTEQQFESIKLAADSLDYSPGTLTNYLTGALPFPKKGRLEGYGIRYADDAEFVVAAAPSEKPAIRAQAVLVTTPEGVATAYSNVRQAAAALGCAEGSLARIAAVEGPYKSKGRLTGYHAEYVSQDHPRLDKPYESRGGRKKAVSVQWPDGSTTRYLSVNEAAEAVGMGRPHFTSRLNGKLPWTTTKTNKHFGVSATYI